MNSAGRVKVSFAQNGEDVRAWRALRDVEAPVYVEVGASHPFDDSLTAGLHALGWRGLLVEADPEMAEQLRRARPEDTVVAAAAHSAPGLMAFSPAEARGQGTVGSAPVGQAATVTVPAVRLADVLADVGAAEVHFLSVDVEGHEAEALAGLDLARWRPWVLCVEATAPDSREQIHGAWEPLVLDNAYRYVTFDGLNRWYVAEEHADRADAVAEPFGILDTILDGWQRRDLVERDARVAALEETVEEATAARAALEARAARLDVLAEQRHQAARTAEAAVSRLQAELAAVAAQRDAAAARETVMLRSKSWRVTAPLRSLRLRAGARLEQRTGRGSSAGTGPAVLAQPLPGDARRLSALAQRVHARRERAGA